MTVTRKKVYFAAIGLAAAAWGMDRLFNAESVTAPGTALATLENGIRTSSAEIVGNGSPTLVSTSGGRGPISSLMITSTPFPASLPDVSNLANGENLLARDIFALSETVTSLLLDTPVDSKNPQDENSQSIEAENNSRTKEGFIRQHRLLGVMIQGRIRYAIVDGAWIRIGQEVDGCELLKIEGDKAYFRCLDGEARLSVAGE